MTTTIEWVRNSDATQGETWNPVTGCTKVSEGCDHCYAERITNRFGGPGAFDTVVLHPERLDKPLRWRKPRTVFVNSMSDLFHDDVPDEFITRVFTVMALAPLHTFQVLTKRPGRMASFCRRFDWDHAYTPEADRYFDEGGDVDATHVTEWPLPNVWLGTSVETQKWADVRIPKLLQTPAAVRFLSVEPLLGPVDLSHPRAKPGRFCEEHNSWLCQAGQGECGLGTIDWVIVGGESGPGARPMHPDWARSLRDQCVDVGVPFFFKQWGEWYPFGGWLNELPESTAVTLFNDGTRVCRIGKKRAGRELDGRTWDEMPTVAS